MMENICGLEDLLKELQLKRSPFLIYLILFKCVG